MVVCWGIVADECVGQKLPLVGDYFVHDVPPSDNVSVLFSCER